MDALLSSGQQNGRTADPAKGRLAIAEDQRLVNRCLRGEPAAWTELYQQCHHVLLAVAVSMHAGRPDGHQIAEEIAARVWYRLVADDSRLLRRFAAERGCRLNAYLAGICRHQALNFRKQQRRKRLRERIASGLASWRQAEAHAAPADSEFLNGAAPRLAEFVSVLTPRERQFYESVLVADRGTNAQHQYSAANVRQLRSRIRRKLIRFLDR